MTKEDALFFLARFRTKGINEKLYDALGVAIEALNAQPSAADTNVVTTDTISRQAAIDKFEPWLKVDGYSEGELNMLKAVLYELRVLPSAQSGRKKGKWIYNSPVTMRCNQCGFVIKDWDWHRFKYCPNCIADMRGESNG